MSTLHTFGCSYTAFYENSKRKEYIEYKKFNGGKFPKIWPELLSEKLNFDLNNLGAEGSSNYEIFHSFCDNIENLKKDDIVIIGWSYKERFRIVNPKTKQFVRVGPGFFPNPEIKGVSEDCIEEILVNRMEKRWVDEVVSWEKIIKKLCDFIGVKLLIWSFDTTIPKHDGFAYLLNHEYGATNILEETDGKIDDHHYGTKGHMVQADYFLGVINGNIIYNYKEKKLI